MPFKCQRIGVSVLSLMSAPVAAVILLKSLPTFWIIIL